MVHTQYAPRNRYEAAMAPVQRTTPAQRRVATVVEAPYAERDDGFARAMVIALPVSLALWVPLIWGVSHLF